MTAQVVRLGDVADMLSGFSFKSEQFLESSEDGIYLVRGDNVQQGYIRWGEKAKKWRSDAYEDLARYQLQKDDVILAMDRPIVGGGLKLAWIKDDDLPSLLVQRVTRIRGVAEKARTNYLRYALSAPNFLAHIDRITTGANIPHISGKDIASFVLGLPTLAEQDRIVDFIARYDHLIETNQRRIALLEEAARMLYREWFVERRFSGFENCPLVNGLPEGWRLLAYSEVADFLNGFAFKPAHLSDFGFPVVKIPELRDGVSHRTPRNSGDTVPDKNKIDTGDLLFSWSATLLVNEWLDGPALLNQHLFKVVPRFSSSKRFIRFALEAAIPALLGQSVGATMQHIRRSALDEHLVQFPDEDIRTDFAALIDPICDKAIALRQQNNALTEARDNLLPRILSGEVQV